MKLRSWQIPAKSLVIMMIVLFALASIGSVQRGFTSGLRRICDIQGKDTSSPFAGKEVSTKGVVYGDLDTTTQRGFFLQDSACDQDSDTSDGIFIYLDERVDLVVQGDLVEVTGMVEEYYGFTRIVALPGDVQIISHSSLGYRPPAPETMVGVPYQTQYVTLTL